MKYIWSILFSLFIVLIWAAGFFNLDGTNKEVTTFLALACCPIGVMWFVQYILKKPENLNQKVKLIIISLPAAYSLVFLALGDYGIKNIIISFLSSPLLAGLIILILILWKNPRITFREIPYYLLVIALYSFLLFPYWQERYMYNQFIDDIDFFYENSETKLKPMEKDINLYNFSFVDASFDTLNLTDNGRYTIIKTWNETCLPCIIAFKDLDPFFEQMSSEANIIYLYESSRAITLETYKKIFDYKHIKDKSMIFIDYSQNLYNSLDMQGYPYFLIFDQNGKFIFEHFGYHKGVRNNLIDEIKYTIGLLPQK